MKTSLIVTIVRKGWGTTVLEASVKAGARGGTVIGGRGSGIHEQGKLFGLPIEPEKEVVLTLVPEPSSGRILEAVVAAAHLSKEGNGIAFVVPVDRVVGAAHFGATSLPGPIAP